MKDHSPITTVSARFDEQRTKLSDLCFKTFDAHRMMDRLANCAAPLWSIVWGDLVLLNASRAWSQCSAEILRKILFDLEELRSIQSNDSVPEEMLDAMESLCLQQKRLL